MKKIFINIVGIIGILMLIPFLQSCTDLLKEENIRVPVADMYYKTADGYKDLLNSCYPPVRLIYATWTNMYNLNCAGGTDIWLNGGDAKSDWNNYQGTVADSRIWGNWQELYNGITACNTTIDRADGVPATEIAETDINKMLGEAYFLRALYYHHLVMHFGGVPLELNEITEVKTTAERATEQEVYDQIIEDLLKAEQFLPESQSDYGRPTMAAAQALLARVYLYNKQFTNAATYAKKVINDHNFLLLENYGDLWDIENEVNNEFIFVATFVADPLLGSASTMQHVFLGRYDTQPGLTRTIEYGRPFRNIMPSRRLLDIFAASLAKGDSRWDGAFRSVWFSNTSTPPSKYPNMNMGDTALWTPPYVVSDAQKEWAKDKYTILDPTFNFGDGTLPVNRQVFPSLIKYDDPTRPSVNSTHGTHDIPILRLGEMYLIAAEALMMDGKASDGLTYFNELRRRAAYPGREADMEITQAELTIDAILEERALELAGEYQRWPDLKRTGKLEEYVKLYNPDGADNIQMPKDLLRPIPQNMIDRITNKEEFEQNPGW